MSRLDRFLTAMAIRGGIILRLAPGELPTIDLPGGIRQQLMTNEILGSVLDGVAREVLPEHLQTDYLRGDRTTFEYACEGINYQVVCSRTKFGTHLVVARLGDVTPKTAPTSAPLPGSPSTPTDAPAQPPSPPAQPGLETFLRPLLGEGGSDLYLTAGEPPIVRKDGQVGLLQGLPVLDGPQLDTFLKSWMPATSYEAYQSGLDVEFAATPPGLLMRLRVRVVHDHNGPALALRVAPKVVPDADTLGLSETIRRLINLNKGLVLFAGPAGSGKTTTQSCLLDLANQTRKAFIVTIQDSIEYEFTSGTCLIRQKEVGRDPERHRRAIRAALQLDPDILALGELRDAESMDLALQAAQTGRLVLAQVPASSLPDTLYRLVDAFPADRRPWARSRLADHLKAVVVHTLLGRIGGSRVAAMETLFNNPSVAAVLREGRLEQIPATMRSGRYGQVSHNEALVRLIQDQKVEPMEAYQHCQDRDSFIAACKKAGISFDPRAEGQVTEE